MIKTGPPDQITQPRRTAQKTHHNTMINLSYVALALAPHKRVTFDEIDRAVRTEPEGLLPWYALAAKAVPNVNQNRLQALRESHKLIEILLPKRAKRPTK